MASEDKFAGGKGINVSRVLKRLDIENTATGFIGGFTGRFIEDVLTGEAISTNFVTVDQDTPVSHTHLDVYKRQVAYGFSPAGAVDFWFNEKATYQKMAAQYGLSRCV